jgi:hypothetical protein
VAVASDIVRVNEDEDDTVLVLPDFTEKAAETLLQLVYLGKTKAVDRKTLQEVSLVLIKLGYQL